MYRLFRLYPPCNTGDICKNFKYKYNSICAHKCEVQKVYGGAGKMVEENHAHQTQILKNKIISSFF